MVSKEKKHYREACKECKDNVQQMFTVDEKYVSPPVAVPHPVMSVNTTISVTVLTWHNKLEIFQLSLWHYLEIYQHKAMYVLHFGLSSCCEMLELSDLRFVNRKLPLTIMVRLNVFQHCVLSFWYV